MKASLALAAGALASLGGSARAQTLFVHDGPQAVVRELSGPPDPLFCFYPDGPLKSSFTTLGPFPCALPGPLPTPPELRGDVAVDRPKDTVWVTDGTRIAEYDAQGVALNSFAPPPGLLIGPVLGLGCDGAQGTLWLTDGQRAAELLPPLVPCSSPSVVTPPFTLPPLGTPGPVTDIDWNPASSTLWICNAAGTVGNVQPGGALLASFQAVPGPCVLQSPLLGLAVDSSVPGAGALYLTDGAHIANVSLSGALAPKTFGQPTPCFGVPLGLAYGVGFSSRGITFGPRTPGGPEMGSTGEAVIPSTSLAVTLAGATPGALAILPFSLSPLCPPITAVGVQVVIFPSAFALFSHVVDTSGEASQAIVIPPTTTVGLEVYYQWFVLGSGPAPSPDGSPLLSSGGGSMRTGFH